MSRIAWTQDHVAGVPLRRSIGHAGPIEVGHVAYDGSNRLWVWSSTMSAFRPMLAYDRAHPYIAGSSRIAAMTSPAASPLISPEQLAGRLNEPDLLVLDVRQGEAFAAGHVPGAAHSDYAADGWRVARGGAGGLLPDADALAALFGRLGLRPDHHVVVVSAGAGLNDFNAAARVYWTLKVAGHNRVSLLDGGSAGWARDPARPVENGPAKTRPATRYPVRIDKRLRAELADVEEAVARRSAALVDARSAASFEGGEKSPLARVGGRLPGAVLADVAQAYDPAANRLRPREELEQAFARVPEGEAITYCNTGHSAAGEWFVLSEVLGRPGVKLYDGSMSEWTQDSNRPVETGPTPPSPGGGGSTPRSGGGVG